MRIAAISDMHGNAVAFEAVIEDLRRQSPDVVVCLGDIVMRGPQPMECIDMLRALDPLVTVQGNYDHLLAQGPKPDWTPTDKKGAVLQRALQYDRGRVDEGSLAWLDNLPRIYSALWEGVQVELFHAAPWSRGHITWPWASQEDVRELREDKQTRLVLFGHVHHAFIRQAGGWGMTDGVAPLVVNVGSVGMPFDGDNRACYALIDINDGISAQIRRVSYDVQRVVRIAEERAFPDIEILEYAVKQADYYMNATVRS